MFGTPLTPRWGWLDESRAVIETYVPPIASVVQAVTRGTVGVVTEVAGFDSRHTFLQHRREAQRQERVKARRERAKTQRRLQKQKDEQKAQGGRDG
jgi:hypothetical protein